MKRSLSFEEKYQIIVDKQAVYDGMHIERYPYIDKTRYGAIIQVK